MASVYIETSIVSYLTAQSSRDVITLARQELTRGWWETRRYLYSLVTSEIVLDEAAAGDERAAERRLQILSGVRLIDLSAEAEALARRLIVEGPLQPIEKVCRSLRYEPPVMCTPDELMGE